MSQRYAIYLGKQKGETLEIIAQSIGVNKSTVNWELRRNSTASGKYVWNKAHEMSESRQKRTPGNRGLDSTLVWRIKELIKKSKMRIMLKHLILKNAWLMLNSRILTLMPASTCAQTGLQRESKH